MKIVRESLFETFKEYSDPIEDMGIGDKSGVFIDKIDTIAKTFGFKKEEDISRYNDDLRRKGHLEYTALAMWTKDETKTMPKFNLCLFKRNIYEIDDVNNYEMSYTSLIGTGVNLAKRWIDLNQWEYHFLL